MAMKIRAYILVMTGAIVLPIAIFAAVALETLLRSERDAALSTMKEAADATALLVDNELSSAEAALRVLALSPHLASGDMESFYRHARTADRGEGGRTILFLASGQQLINTVVPLGAKLPPPPDYVRTRARDVIESGRTEVAILDIGLPGLDGYQLAARLRADAATRPMRLIALTGYGQASDRERALGAGFDAHLVKPVKFDELARELAGA
ncbi:MAG TPA: hypothetical protein DCP94_07730 [Massilia timonae]|nr:hypothetical protein [Massilia timonae]